MATVATGASLCFARVLASFKKQLDPKIAMDFQTTSLHDLRRCIAKIEKKQATEKRLQNMGRLSNFVTIMENYSKIIEVFTNATDILAFIWGPIKFLLQIASSVAEAFHELLATYKMIGDSLPHIEISDGVLQKYPCVQQALESMFQDIFEFHQAALLYFRKPMWKHIFQATWSTYKTRFGPIVDSLKSHKQLFGERLTFTQLEEIRSTATKSAEDIEKLMKDQMMGQLREVQCWLDGADVATDQETLRLTRSGNPQSGSWLLRHILFLSWKDGTSGPLLWLNGIPGAGKTVLASILVDRCLKDHSQHTTWFYFRSGDVQRESFLSFARSTISQILEQNTDLLPYIYEEMCRRGKKTLSSDALAKELLEVTIRNSGNISMIIDGLDECNRVERGKVIEWIQAIIDKSQLSSCNVIKCIYVSQRDRVTTRALKDATTLEIGANDTHKDILAYLSSRAVEIQDKFRISDEARCALVALVMENARGMFLLAKLVMRNLFSQVSSKALSNELRAERIPTRLEEAYDRIMKNILEDDFSRAHALQLLAWLVCAKRHLKWREVQGAVSIDLEDEDVDNVGRRWILNSRDLCDSLVENRTDGSLELVHTTAKLFLIQSGTINVQKEEVKMAHLCVGYLSLPGFEICLPDETIKDLTRTGYYAFMDYAVCFWSQHIWDGLKDILDQATATTLAGILSKFLDSHYQDPEGKVEISQAVREIHARVQISEVWPDSEKFLRALNSTKKQLSSFKSDAACNDCLDIPAVVTRIRQLLENVFSDNSVDYKRLEQLYGDCPYKCPRLSCDFFHQGFQTPEQRESHMNKHDRPYGCWFAQCYRSTIRFSSKGLLEKHIADAHQQQKRDSFAFPSKRAKLLLVCRFCKAQFQDTKLYRGHKCPSKGSDVSSLEPTTEGLEQSKTMQGVDKMSIPLPTDQIWSMTPQQRAAVEERMRKEQKQFLRGPILSRAAAEENWNKNLPPDIMEFYKEIARNCPPEKVISIPPNQKAPMSQMLMDSLDIISRLDVLVVHGFPSKESGHEKNIRNMSTMRFQIMRQFQNTPDWAPRNDFSITPEYLNGAILFIRKLFQLMIARMNQ